MKVSITTPRNLQELNKLITMATLADFTPQQCSWMASLLVERIECFIHGEEDHKPKWTSVTSSIL